MQSRNKTETNRIAKLRLAFPQSQRRIAKLHLASLNNKAEYNSAIHSCAFSRKRITKLHLAAPQSQSRIAKLHLASSSKVPSTTRRSESVHSSTNGSPSCTWHPAKTPGEIRSPQTQASSPSPTPPPRSWYSRGYLPHFDHPGVRQHICFHLADSLPQKAITRMQTELDLQPAEKREFLRQTYIHDLLDSGHGSCVLRDDQYAHIVQESLFHGDGKRYKLLVWAVMPNHVHILIELTDWPLAKIVQSWKRHTARQINKLRSKTGTPLWQRDYWDRYIRDDEHFARARHYIENNPVKANLITAPELWPWSSARHR